VKEMRGSATVKEMRGSATVKEMRGSATVIIFGGNVEHIIEEAFVVDRRGEKVRGYGKEQN